MYILHVYTHMFIYIICVTDVGEIVGQEKAVNCNTSTIILGRRAIIKIHDEIWMLWEKYIVMKPKETLATESVSREQVCKFQR